MASIAEKVTALIAPTVEELGYKLWDVRFVKEGADWFLRVFIDSEEGISIDDCVTVSHAIDPIIDEADPIDKSYCLEVCSPGLERELIKPEHFNAKLGEKVKVKLYKAIDNQKEFIGLLECYDGDVTINADGEQHKFAKKDVASVKLADFE
jgi:ribosome maturation factor RimP